MNPIAYCTHPETEVISCAVKVKDYPTDVVFGESNIKASLASIDWSDKLVYGHNMSGFDAMILSWRLGVKPAMWGCTLAMAKPIHGLTVGGSLGKLVAHYNLGVKDQTALMQTKGRHLCDFSPEEVEAMKIYNAMDVDQCAGLFKILRPLTTSREMKLIDMTTRMLVSPKFRLDTELLTSALEGEKARKQKVLLKLANAMGNPTDDAEDAAEYIRGEVASAPKFAGLLRAMAIEVPMKPSPSDADKQIPALAKTDQGLLDLLDHENSTVALLAATRLDVKSTILESRIESFLEVGKATGGRMPIAKNYYGAHTGRWSGAFGLNQENLPRVSKKPSDVLRNSLCAPKGMKVVVADLSGIELRVNHFLWKVPSSMSLFQEDAEGDLYKQLASTVFNVPVAEVVKGQRQAAKAMHLGCGFGLGSAEKFVAVAKQMAQIFVTEDEGTMYIAEWRKNYPEIVRGWKLCHAALSAIYQGAEYEIDPWGMCVTSKEGIHTPSGRLRYPGLHKEQADGKEEWWYGEGRNRSRIYAGKVTENIVQHLARNILADNALEIKKQLGTYPCHSVHDELIYIVPAAEAEATLALVQKVMRTPPKWWPELVTWSEGDIGDTYGATK
jgi:hypothetical protein